MKELNKCYLSFADLKKKYKEAAKEYIQKSVAKHGEVFQLKCMDYDSWDDAFEHEGSFITNQMPYGVDCHDGDGSTYFVHLTKVVLSADVNVANVTGYCFDEDYGWIENEPCRLYMENLDAIAEFIHAVMDEETL